MCVLARAETGNVCSSMAYELLRTRIAAVAHTCMLLIGRASSSSGSTRSHKLRRVRINADASATASFPSNEIINTRYTVWTFLPLVLVTQFQTPMNAYFLLIAFLQLWRAITPVNPVTTWAPLLFVLTVTAVREGLDDWKRREADARANSRSYDIYRNGLLKSGCRSDAIRVGDLVTVHADEEVPCDLVLLKVASNTDDGTAKVETANVDGESDLKARCARQETQSLSLPQLCALRAHIDCEPPNSDMYRLDAKLCMSGGAHAHGELALPLTPDQLLQQGIIVRKTRWVLGAAIYTGSDTKQNQSRTPAPRKVSAVDATINTLTVYVFLAQLVLVLVCGVLGHVYAGNDDDRLWYLAWHGEAPAMLPVHVHDAAGAATSETAQIDDPFSVREQGDLAADAFAAALRGRSPPPTAAADSLLHPWYTPLVLPLRFLLLSSMMIPISLKVTLDLIKVLYALYIARDFSMCAEARVLNTAVIEDLGRIQCVLSDKTGTLTENRMRLAAMVVGLRVYGGAQLQADHIRNARVHANLHTAHVEAARDQESVNSAAAAQGVIEEVCVALHTGGAAGRAAYSCAAALALCNSVAPEYVDAVSMTRVSDDSDVLAGVADMRMRAVRYSSSSPDEEALVSACARMGIALCDRVALPGGAQRVMLRVADAATLCDSPAEGDTVWVSDRQRASTFTVLHTLDFSSDRRRMSVLVRCETPMESTLLDGAINIDSGAILLLCKGADDVLYARLSDQARVDADAIRMDASLETLAQHGLRTLVLCARIVPAAEYATWKAAYDNACVEVGAGRAASQEALYDAIEQNLALLGCTAIEDKLQPCVPECISAMRTAGIAVWMLTGDKYATALQIARSAHLVPGHGEVHIVSVRGHSAHAVEEQLRNACASLESTPLQHVLVIEGHAVRHALTEHRLTLFEQCAWACTAVVCCRCTPSQKSALVNMVRRSGRICVAIGDGANDVAMIQAANVGVGISGREGHQAARAADVAISQFGHLQKLLLVHGRLAHRRTAHIAQYTFYKSMCICAVQIMFNASCAFSGCSLLDTFALTTYNLVYTFLPGLALAVDMDYTVDQLMDAPDLYLQSQAAAWITLSTFASWATRAVIQPAIILSVHIVAMAHGVLGGGVDYVTLSYSVFTSLVALQFITVLMDASRWTRAQLLTVGGCAATYLTLLLLRELPLWPGGSSQILAGVLSSPAALMCMLLSITLTTAPLMLARALLANSRMVAGVSGGGKHSPSVQTSIEDNGSPHHASAQYSSAATASKLVAPSTPASLTRSTSQARAAPRSASVVDRMRALVEMPGRMIARALSTSRRGSRRGRGPGAAGDSSDDDAESRPLRGADPEQGVNGRGGTPMAALDRVFAAAVDGLGAAGQADVRSDGVLATDAVAAPSQPYLRASASAVASS